MFKVDKNMNHEEIPCHPLLQVVSGLLLQALVGVLLSLIKFVMILFFLCSHFNQQNLWYITKPLKEKNFIRNDVKPSISYLVVLLLFDLSAFSKKS